MVNSRNKHLPHSTRNNYYCFHSIINIFDSLLYSWRANKFCVFKFIFKLNFVFTIFFVIDEFIYPNSSAIWNLSRLQQILVRKFHNSYDSFIIKIFIFLDVNNLKLEEREQQYFLLLPKAPLFRKFNICSRLIFLIGVNLK